MVGIATGTEYEAKCQRLATLRADLGEIKTEWDAAKADGSATPEKTAAWTAAINRIGVEFEPLKKEVLNGDFHQVGGQMLRDMDAALDSGRKVPLSPDQITAEHEAHRLDILSGRTRGSQRLRHFLPYGNTTEAMAKNRKCALLCGLGLLTQVRMHSDYAKTQLAKYGIGPEKLNEMLVSTNTIGVYAGEDGNSIGGALVFPEFEATLIDLKELYGVLQRNAFKLPMKSDTKTFPRRAGGTTVYYPEENTLITPSSMAFSQVKLIAKKYAQMALWSSELDEDSVINFTDLLTSEMAYQFAKAEDFNGAQGDGTSVYAGVIGFLSALVGGVGGIIPTASVTTIAASASCTTPALWLANKTTAQILAVWNQVVGSLPLYAEGRAKWYMHKTVFWNLIVPVLEAAGGNIAMYLSSGMPLKFLGYDVEVMQAMPTVSQITGVGATNLSIGAVLGDMLMTCYMGTRRGVRVLTSNERFMEFDQLAIQVSQRVAITPVVGDSVVPAQQPGPMVALQFPAT